MVMGFIQLTVNRTFGFWINAHMIAVSVIPVVSDLGQSAGEFSWIK